MAKGVMVKIPCRVSKGPVCSIYRNLGGSMRRLISVVVPLVISSSASTAFTYSCAETSTWAFSPPLTLASASPGSASRNAFCNGAHATVTTSPINEVAGLSNGAGSISASYYGNCVFAIIVWSDGTGYLIGGTLLVGYGFNSLTDGGAAAFVLVPSPGVCNESSASSVAYGNHSGVN